jgi:hypothetical protein
MALDEVAFDEPQAPLLRPWPVLVAGLAAVAVAWLWSLASSGAGEPFRVLLILAGLVAVGAAVALHLPHTGGTRDGRLVSAGLLFLAAVGAGLARSALEGYDSAALVLQVALVAALAGAVLLALPPGAAALVLGGAALLHFGAIATAIVLVPAPGGGPPWLALQAYTRFYRPWLEMTHLNNGYHFYAPEPGPVTLLWFRVQYADGSARWVRIPDHARSRSGLNTRRWGGLATATSQTNPLLPNVAEQLVAQRLEGGQKHTPPIPPLPADQMALPLQYREPQLSVKMLIASYARYVAATTPHPSDPGQAVTGVKVYRADYHNPSADQLLVGLDPLDPSLYHAYYQGEFDPDGTMKPSCLQVRYNKTGEVLERKQDPFLYWLIPIVREPIGKPPPPGPTGMRPPLGPDNSRVVNYLRLHAGDAPEESVP